MKTAIRYILLFALVLVSSFKNGAYLVSAAKYTDVPTEHWADEVIQQAADTGIMYGKGEGRFGLGETVKRSEFAAMLVRLMKWEKSDATKSVFADVSPSSWYFADVNTLAENGAFSGNVFRPDENITRSEMAVMLVKALGYDTLAQEEEHSVFTDVHSDEGHIAVAYTLGIINGKTESLFDPEGFALREEGAAMMMRLHNKLYSSFKEFHGFYAISSWGQKEMGAKLDTVSFGWSRLQYTDDGKVYLNQTTAGGNDWYIPQAHQDAMDYMLNNGVTINLAVAMNDPDDCRAILLNENNRAEAVGQLVTASANYNGITVDFEEMRGDELKEGLNRFIRELSLALDGKRLYVAVHPVLKSGTDYYDGYDYKTLGEYADKIILMAHDYAPVSFPDHLLNTDFIATPVTPFDEVYAALKAITDEETGVQEKDKIMLALSISNTIAWNSDGERITDGKPVFPSMETIEKRLSQSDTKILYSDTYKNPYAFYTTETNQPILLWYEDSRSVTDKMALAKMFGIKAISVWRIGVIPNGDKGTYMNVWDTLLQEREK